MPAILLRDVYIAVADEVASKITQRYRKSENLKTKGLFKFFLLISILFGQMTPNKQTNLTRKTATHFGDLKKYRVTRSGLQFTKFDFVIQEIRIAIF